MTSTTDGRPPATGTWRVGDFEFNSEKRELRSPTTTTRLAVKTAQVLALLIQHADQVVSRDRLILEVWDGNRYTGSRAVTHTIWQLRKLLDADDATESAIVTISKSGYQLRLPVSALTKPLGERNADDGFPARSPDSTVERAPGHRRRQVVSVIGIAVLALLVAALLWAWHGGRYAHPGQRQNHWSNAPAVPLTMLDGVEEYPAFSPDGHWLAYTAQGTGDGFPHIEIRRADDSRAQVRRITDGDFPLARPVWLTSSELLYLRALDGSRCRVMRLNLDDGSRSEVTHCFYIGGVPTIDASPDGHWLAVARELPQGASIAIVLHRLSDGAERILTHPSVGLDDSEIAWSHDGSRIAFLRGGAAVGDLHVIDVASGKEARLTHDQAPVGGITWLSDDSAIAFNSARDGSFNVWSIAPTGGEPQLFARLDSPRNLAAVPGDPHAVAASVHRFSDHIESYQLPDATPRSRIMSSGRDLYAQACPDAEHVLFISLRSGRVALWTSDGHGGNPHEIDLPPGTPEPAGCDANGRFATSFRPAGAHHDSIVIGSLEAATPLQQIPTGASISNVSWSADGQSLLLASDRSGDWDLWRYRLNDASWQRLTNDGGGYGREVQAADGQRWLYYILVSRQGLYRRPLLNDGSTAAPEQISTPLGLEDWADWQFHDGALWLVERGTEADRVVRREPDGRHPDTVLTLPAGTIRPYRSLSIAPDGTLLLTVSGPQQADIVRISNSAVP